MTAATLRFRSGVRCCMRFISVDSSPCGRQEQYESGKWELKNTCEKAHGCLEYSDKWETEPSLTKVKRRICKLEKHLLTIHLRRAFRSSSASFFPLNLITHKNDPIIHNPTRQTINKQWLEKERRADRRCGQPPRQKGTKT